jgi:hypothetical protein
VLREPGENPGDLRGSFPFPKNHLRHSRTKRAVMIDFCKPEIFEWQMSQAIDRVVRRKGAISNLLEKLADGFGVQEVLKAPSAKRANLDYHQRALVERKGRRDERKILGDR